MRIISVDLPKIIPYYLSKKSIELLNKKIKDCEVKRINDELHFYRENDLDLFNILSVLKTKTEKVTAGNQFVYEYELDINIKNGHLFHVELDDGNNYNISLFHIGNLTNSDMHIIFKIVN